MNAKKNVKNKIIATGQYPDYKSEIAEIIRSNLSPVLIRERMLTYHENDIAAAMELLKKDERYKLYNILDTVILANILEYSGRLTEYINELSIHKRVKVLSQLEATISVECLKQMDMAGRNLIIELMDDEKRREITLLSSFDEDEIGSKMTTNCISVCSGISVREAMRELIDQAAENDNVSTIYVVDDENVLVGAIDLKDLIVARDNTRLEAITKTSYPYIYASEQIDGCIERIKDYSEDSIPVLDSDNRLKGVLISQDITRLVDEKMGDDYAKLAGLSAEEDLQEPLNRSISKRLPWLIILLGLGLVVSSVVGMFENVIMHLTIIVSFQSLILDMAGNVGTQSLAVTIRVLMDEQLNCKQKIFLVEKESRIGLVNGMILGVLSFVFIGGYLVILKGQSIMFAFSVSLCTGVSLMVSILFSSFFGTIVPLFLKKLNIDPAVASGPMITTINDLVAVVVYYGLAWVLLINVLHL